MHTKAHSVQIESVNEMAIEIRELVIRAVVTDGGSESEKLERALVHMKQEILEACRERLQELVRRVYER